MNRLEKVVFLAADTIRSRAYAQALLAKGYRLDAILIVRAKEGPRWGQANQLPPEMVDYGDLFVPNLNIPLEETCKELSARVEEVETGTINSSEVVEWLRSNKTRLIVYSGFGGEIVKAKALDAAGDLLHMHAGWLPDFRGSTTVYYSYLSEKKCGVSAILLSRKIDKGPIVGQKKYPPPPLGANVDYYYDSIIRADLLVQVLVGWNRNGAFANRREQGEGGDTYYIIHPVLKHIALNAIHDTAGSAVDMGREGQES